MKIFEGYLFSKLSAIGSKSEGPQYFIQFFNYKEQVVIKHVEAWKPDPVLHQFLDKKVTIEGALAGDSIEYKNISEYKPGHGV